MASGSTDQVSRERAVEAVVSHKLGGRFISAEPAGGGFSGAWVYRVRAEFPFEDGRARERELMIKVGRLFGAPVTDDLDPARMYAARSHNLRPVHALLRAKGLPTYDLLAFELPSPEVPYVWAAMSPLQGLSLGEWHDRTGGEERAALHRFTGDALGRVHAITRAYDGWVDQATPYRVDWGTAYFRALESSLDDALRHERAHAEQRGQAVRAGDDSLAGHEGLLREFIDGHRRRWVPAREYVLSHVDGIQALATRETGDTGEIGDTGSTGDASRGPRWVLTGHVDLEDMAFMDARMPLASQESAFEDAAEFWAGYRRHKAVDPTYPATRNLFRLGHPLAMIRHVYRSLARGDHRDPTEPEDEIRRRTHAIVALATQPHP